MSEQPKGRRLGTFRQTAEAYPAFSEASLRWMRFNGDKNGFNDCVIELDGKLIIDWDRLDKLLDSRINDGGAK